MPMLPAQQPDSGPSGPCDSADAPSRVLPRLPGLDLLKLVLVIAVLCIHSTFFSFRAVDPFPGMTPWVLVFDVYALFVSCAVPTFVAISLYLYVRKRVLEPDYYRTRISRLFRVLAFWWPVYAIAGWAVGYRGFTRDVVGVLTMPVTDGGLYFLGTVVLLVLICEALIRFREAAGARASDAANLVALLGCHAAVVAAFVFLPNDPAHLRKLIDLGPLMFLPLAPAVALIVTSASRRRALVTIAASAVGFEVVYLWSAGVLTDAVAGVPANYFGITYIHPVMTLVATSLLVLALARVREVPGFVRTVARYSLGFYLVHILVYPQVMNYLARPTIPVTGGEVFFNPLAFIVIASVTAGILWVLARTPLKRYIA